MHIVKKLLSSLLLLLLITVFSPSAWAQQEYQELVQKQQQQQMFFQFLELPGRNDSTVTFASAFSLSYDYLPFKKNNRSTSGKDFFSTAELTLEVLQSKGSSSSVENMEPVARAMWSDTAYAASFEATKSRQQYLEGNLSVNLQPGSYNYVVQLKQGDQAEGRLSRSQHREINRYSALEKGTIVMGESAQPQGSPPTLELSSLGDNVPYGKDAFALAYLPDYNEEARYTLHVEQLRIADGDTSKAKETHSQQIQDNHILKGVKPVLARNQGNNILRMDPVQEGFSYALVKIPNSTFPNAHFRVRVQNETTGKVAAEGIYTSKWVDMPTSLLSLDVAIDMLHYIVDEETRRNISGGSAAEQEKKFRAFWDQRDPTPKTAYNELMAEYYRRIDYAYENFSTENTIGYESDRGKIYIKRGAPQNIERKFPANGATVEIWEYANSRFIFRATSGFGDFKLIRNS